MNLIGGFSNGHVHLGSGSTHEEDCGYLVPFFRLMCDTLSMLILHMNRLVELVASILPCPLLLDYSLP
jgi:hypothetical protein